MIINAKGCHYCGRERQKPAEKMPVQLPQKGSKLGFGKKIDDAAHAENGF